MNLKSGLLPLAIMVSMQFGIVTAGEHDFIQAMNPEKQEIYINASNGYKNNKVLLDVPIVCQKPELYNGCEICSLAMLLQYAGVSTGKITLARQIRRDSTPLVVNSKGKIIKWGNPHHGFVGDITGRKKGYGVHHEPILELLEKYLPGRSVNMTGKPFDSILKKLDGKRPVIMWVTVNFTPPSRFKTWNKGSKTISVTFSEHAVLLVGYDNDYCYINNPYNGVKNQRIRKELFRRTWESMGSMAVSYR